MPSTVVTFFPIPSGTAEGTGNYTVPADTFAQLSGHTAASAVSYTRNSTAPQASGTGSADSNDILAWLDEGDTVATANAVASASTTSAAAGLTASTTADILVNGTVVCRSIATGHTSTALSGTVAANITGSASARYVISEFTK